MASELKSTFSKEDVATLIEAMGDWEMVGNHEFHVLQLIKNAPMPPEDHEAHDYMQQIKDHFYKREKDIMASRETRQEKAVMLKAKLMLVRRDMAINTLFDMANTAESSASEAAGTVVAEMPTVSSEPAPPIPMAETSDDSQEALRKAEKFIDDLGVWKHYQKFLADNP